MALVNMAEVGCMRTFYGFCQQWRQLVAVKRVTLIIGNRRCLAAYFRCYEIVDKYDCVLIST